MGSDKEAGRRSARRCGKEAGQGRGQGRGQGPERGQEAGQAQGGEGGPARDRAEARGRARGRAGAGLGIPSSRAPRPRREAGGTLQAVYFDTADRDAARGRALRAGARQGRGLDPDREGRARRDRASSSTATNGRAPSRATRSTSRPRAIRPSGRFWPATRPRGAHRPRLHGEDRAPRLHGRARGRAGRARPRPGRDQAGRRKVRFGEVELELKAGEPAALFGLARALAEAAPLRLSLATKASRGYALLAGGPDAREGRADRSRVPARPRRRPSSASPAPASSRRSTTRRSCARPARRPPCTRCGSASAPARRDLPVQGSVRGSRERTRPRGAALRSSHALGPARDLDVLAGRLSDLPEAERAPGHAAQAARVEERRDARHGPRSPPSSTRPAPASSPSSAAAWIEAGDWLRSADPEARAARADPAAERARTELARRWKRVLQARPAPRGARAPSPATSSASRSRSCATAPSSSRACSEGAGPRTAATRRSRGSRPCRRFWAN